MENLKNVEKEDEEDEYTQKLAGQLANEELMVDREKKKRDEEAFRLQKEREF